MPNLDDNQPDNPRQGGNQIVFDRPWMAMTDANRLSEPELRAIIQMRNGNLMEYIDDVRLENEHLRDINPSLQVVSSGKRFCNIEASITKFIFVVKRL